MKKLILFFTTITILFSADKWEYGYVLQRGGGTTHWGNKNPKSNCDWNFRTSFRSIDTRDVNKDNPIGNIDKFWEVDTLYVYPPIQLLNKLGEDGWELVDTEYFNYNSKEIDKQTGDSDDGERNMWIFKRKISKDMIIYESPNK